MLPKRRESLTTLCLHCEVVISMAMVTGSVTHDELPPPACQAPLLGNTVVMTMAESDSNDRSCQAWLTTWSQTYDVHANLSSEESTRFSTWMVHVEILFSSHTCTHAHTNIHTCSDTYMLPLCSLLHPQNEVAANLGKQRRDWLRQKFSNKASLQ